VAVRYADDLVLVFEQEDDACRVLEVLSKRLGKYGLALHPDKTRLVPFVRPPFRDRNEDGRRGGGPGSFDFLGLTHFWGRSRRGYWVVRQKTAKSRLSRTVTTIDDWCRVHRHWAIAEQHRALGRRLMGHYAYFGLTGNHRSLWQVFRAAGRSWRKWLGRRSAKAKRSWEWFEGLTARYPLPRPRIVHSAVQDAAKP